LRRRRVSKTASRTIVASAGAMHVPTPVSTSKALTSGGRDGAFRAHTPIATQLAQ
jgi:hypothetical protein